MEVQFDVKMNTSKLYDFNLQHTYKKPISILVTAIGFVLIVLFAAKLQWFYLVFGLIAILYTPITLLTSSATKVKLLFPEPLHYLLNDEGITVSVGEESETIPWENCIKACNTKQSYFVYTAPNAAFIFPQKDMGDKNVDVLKMICEHMDPKHVKIKFGGL